MHSYGVTAPHLRLVTPEPGPDVEAGSHSESGGVPSRMPSLDELYRSYSRYVAWFAARILGRSEDVDDVVHDVFVSAAEQLGDIREPMAIKRWLATVTVRQAQRRLQRRRWLVPLGFGESLAHDDLSSREASPEDRALLSEVYRRLDRVPPEVRIAWVLRYMEGEKLGQVAELCGCSLAAVKRRLSKAHDAMKDLVDVQ